MTAQSDKTGGFTLPGEAGYEDLTLTLARRWGADTIRDCDGTQLSDKITNSGYDIYSTLCLVRSDNEWAKAHRDKLQQNYLMSRPVVAESETVQIDPLAGYFREQFTLNTRENPKEYWQVFDRTTGQEVPKIQWDFDAASGKVTVHNAKPWHKYTVNFLTVRIWEEISMYNHITNNWGDREHLMTIDPIYPECQEFILAYLEKWLAEHPHTKVVRFTSMFYNFCWFWGDDLNQRYLYGDWGSYDFTVNPYSLKLFEQKHGFRPDSEVFVNRGLYNSTHNAPSAIYRQWIEFINEFVVNFGRKCIDLVHKHGKKAYVFYDDHWIGVEPYHDRFEQFGFDGIIKCVFNGFEARKCAGVKGVKTHELRLHPYLFPTGLKGEPTFAPGGNPGKDAREFWINIRRALLREPVDRIGLGGYLHLVEPFPDFVQAIDDITNEFRTIKGFYAQGKPYSAPCRVAILTAWGKLRSWICSGHMTHGLELNEIIESLAGLPLDVQFISFEDLLADRLPKETQVIINAGRLGTAWSGGENWANPKVIEKISQWVASGGGFIGVGEPSAALHSSQYFQLSDVLGVDRSSPLRMALGNYKYKKPNGDKHFITSDLTIAPDFGKGIDNIYVLGPTTQVLADKDKSPTVAIHPFGKGRSVYLSGHKFNPENTRLLTRAIFWAANRETDFDRWRCTNVYTECAWYPGSRKLVIINNSGERQQTQVLTENGHTYEATLEPYAIEIATL